MYSARFIRFGPRALSISKICRDSRFSRNSVQVCSGGQHNMSVRVWFLKRLMFVRNVDPLARLRNTVGKVGSGDVAWTPTIVLIVFCCEIYLQLLVFKPQFLGLYNASCPKHLCKVAVVPPSSIQFSGCNFQITSSNWTSRTALSLSMGLWREFLKFLTNFSRSQDLPRSKCQCQCAQ